MVLSSNNIFGAKLREYAARYRDHSISILVDRIPFTQEQYCLLAELFPKGRIILCHDLCIQYGLSFYELTSNCIELNDVYLILENSAGRVDHLVKLLLEKGVPSDAILTGVSEYRKQVDIGQLFRMQHFDSVICNADTFSRYAIIIRFMFIEAWEHHSQDGFELYRKYLAAKKYDGYDCRKERFENLLQSFWTKGAQDLWIAVDEQGRIIDGSHRMAICLYLGISLIQVRYMNTSERLDSGKEWLLTHFSDYEQKMVVRKYYEIADKYLQHSGDNP